MSVDALPPSSDASAGRDLAGEVLGSVADAVVAIDTAGTVVVWNAAAERLLARPAHDCVGRRLSDLGLLPLDELVASASTMRTWPCARELRLSAAAETRRVLVQASRLGPEESPTGVVLTMAEVLDRTGGRTAEQERLEVLVQYSADVVALLDARGVLQFCTTAAAASAGFAVDELIGRDAFELVHPDDAPAVRQAVRGITAIDGAGCDLLFRFRDRRGDYRWMQGRAVNLLDRPSVRGVLVSAHDVSDRVANETELAYQATHDPLTGLPNRALFLDRLTLYIEHARRHGQLVAVLFWDLDKFKTVNDLGGHVVGDSVLVETARQALQALRAEDTVARLGGDEFVACAEVHDEAQAEALAQRLLDLVPVDVSLGGGRRLQVTSSIGVVCGVDASADTLLVEADRAMYDAKRRGGRSLSVRRL